MSYLLIMYFGVCLERCLSSNGPHCVLGTHGIVFYCIDAISCMVVVYAVLASLLSVTYDGGEWIPGFVFVHST